MRSRSMPRLSQIILAFLSLGLLSRPASAATLSVPSQYATIQAAVNAAQNGDTVLIADGTYTGPGNVDIDFGGKNITVTSQHGAGATIIDCQGSANTNHRGFYLHSGETNAVISGFTIQNGFEGGNGGGGNGGGIYEGGSGLTVQSCVFNNNAAPYGFGGGLYASTGYGSTESLWKRNFCDQLRLRRKWSRLRRRRSFRRQSERQSLLSHKLHADRAMERDQTAAVSLKTLLILRLPAPLLLSTTFCMEIPELRFSTKATAARMQPLLTATFRAAMQEPVAFLMLTRNLSAGLPTCISRPARPASAREPLQAHPLRHLTDEHGPAPPVWGRMKLFRAARQQRPQI